MSAALRAARLAPLMLVAALFATSAFAQGFGRNKVQYENFEFRSFETPHFTFYYYPEAEQAVQDAARMAERWYQRHSRTYLNAFEGRKPIIFYANDADFQQTNVIQGQLGEGTGGVTESLKQRVVMPLTGNYADTDHVLGHELVHSFQYDIALSKLDTLGFNLGLMPLWMIEGTAEYLSVGRRDAHTAMWLRDALIRDELPTIRDLSSGRIFPYRFGQAVMAYIGGTYGDAAVANLYRMAGRTGVDSAFVYTLGITTDSLSSNWHEAVRESYLPELEGRTPPDSAGRLVLAESIDAGSMNIAPQLSPDGRYVAYLSERDLFNINLFIADANTGETVQKLRETAGDPHFDAIRFIASSGTWSPDGKRFAFVTFVEGDNEISIYNAERRQIERRFAVSGVGALSNPSWGPDGRTIAFSGIQGGISDLYLLDVETSEVQQLTNDRYADMQPVWSPDGRTIAFTTDRGPDGTNFETLDYAHERLGFYHLDGDSISVRVPFPDAMHHNPDYSPDGRSLFFISDQDGFKDVYRLELATDELFRVTRLQTGVSGITNKSPAMTVARETGRMLFSVFFDNEYTVFGLEADETQGEPVVRDPAVQAPVAKVLPPIGAVNVGLVAAYMSDPTTDLPDDLDFTSEPYSARLKLDWVAPPSIGVGVSTGPFGRGGVQGGVAAGFSDVLGNHNLVLVAQANGTLKDVGGQAIYTNLRNRYNWGGGVSHIPYLLASYPQYLQRSDGNVEYVQQRNRVYVTQAATFASYPFSRTRRIEGQVGLTRYGFDTELERYLFSPNGQFLDRVEQNGQSCSDIADSSDPFARAICEPDAIYLAQTGAAFVGDYANFGFTSPIQGGRYRFDLTGTYGTYTFATLLADYRRYFYTKPFTFAVRGLHRGNYGIGTDETGTRIGQEFLYSPYFPGFVRGYGITSIDTAECGQAQLDPETNTIDSCPVFNRLIGTRTALASAEIRTILLGTEDIGLLKFPYLPTELALFADAGVAWSEGETPRLDFVTGDEARTTTDAIPVTSVGATARMNVLGFAIVEVFYAMPFQRPDEGWHFGFAIAPGW
jgi:dipeptidyl aminopeptidase/acylaminoacyl peptidase